MRKRWILVPLLSVVASAAAAQNTAPRFGLFGGMNQAHVDGSNLSDISNRTGAAFGAYFVAPLQSGWSFQVGGGYSMKGWKRVEPGTRDVANVNVDYLEVPAMLRYDFAAMSGPGVFIFGGPGLGFRTRCNADATQASTGITSSASCDDISNAGGMKFKSVDLGAIVGAGVRVPIGGNQLVLSTQYEHGLTNIEDSRDIKNRAFTFSLGFELPIGR